MALSGESGNSGRGDHISNKVKAGNVAVVATAEGGRVERKHWLEDVGFADDTEVGNLPVSGFIVRYTLSERMSYAQNISQAASIELWIIWINLVLDPDLRQGGWSILEVRVKLSEKQFRAVQSLLAQSPPRVKKFQATANTLFKVSARFSERHRASRLRRVIRCRATPFPATEIDRRETRGSAVTTHCMIRISQIRSSFSTP